MRHGPENTRRQRADPIVVLAPFSACCPTSRTGNWCLLIRFLTTYGEKVSQAPVILSRPAVEISWQICITVLWIPAQLCPVRETSAVPGCHFAPGSGIRQTIPFPGGCPDADSASPPLAFTSPTQRGTAACWLPVWIVGGQRLAHPHVPAVHSLS